MPSSIDFEHLLRRLAEREGGYDIVHTFRPAGEDRLKRWTSWAVLAVFAGALVTALATGLGAGPFLFVAHLARSWVGRRERAGGGVHDRRERASLLRGRA